MGIFSSIREIIVDGFTFADGFTGFLMATLMSALILLVSTIIICGIVYLADNIGMESQVGYGTIIERTFVPEHTTTSTTYVNNIPVTTTTVIPDAWYVTIKMDDLTDTMSVTYDYYNHAYKNMNVKFRYVSGRFTGGLYVKEILQE